MGLQNILHSPRDQKRQNSHYFLWVWHFNWKLFKTGLDLHSDNWLRVAPTALWNEVRKRNNLQLLSLFSGTGRHKSGVRTKLPNFNLRPEGWGWTTRHFYHIIRFFLAIRRMFQPKVFPGQVRSIDLTYKNICEAVTNFKWINKTFSGFDKGITTYKTYYLGILISVIWGQVNFVIWPL